MLPYCEATAIENSIVIIRDRKDMFLTLITNAQATKEATNKTPTILSTDTAIEAATHDPMTLRFPILALNGIRETDVNNSVRAKISLCKSHEVLNTGNCRITNSAKYVL